MLSNNLLFYSLQWMRNRCDRLLFCAPDTRLQSAAAGAGARGGLLTSAWAATAAICLPYINKKARRSAVAELRKTSSDVFFYCPN